MNTSFPKACKASPRGGAVVKHQPPMQATWDFYPWDRKIPWRRKWQPTPVLLPGKPHGQRSLVDYSPWDCRVGHDWVIACLACSFTMWFVITEFLTEYLVWWENNLFKITLQFERVHIRVKTSVCNMRRLMYKTKPQSQYSPNSTWLRTSQLTIEFPMWLTSVLHSVLLPEMLMEILWNRNHCEKFFCLLFFSDLEVSISGFITRCLRIHHPWRNNTCYATEVQNISHLFHICRWSSIQRECLDLQHSQPSPWWARRRGRRRLRREREWGSRWGKKGRRRRKSEGMKWN